MLIEHMISDTVAPVLQAHYRLLTDRNAILSHFPLFAIYPQVRTVISP